MTTRHLLHDAGHCLRAAIPPLLALSVFALPGKTQGEVPSPGGVAEVVLVAWRAAVLGTLLWFLVAVVWAASRPLRDRRAFQRLQHLREIATPEDRALVHVQTIVWSSAAGQYVAVLNVMTGAISRVWLPESAVRVGSFGVLERADGGVSVADWLDSHQVEAGHRHERRHIRVLGASALLSATAADPLDRDDARQLIEETEQFLKWRS